MSDQTWDEKTALKEIIAQLQKLVRPLDAVTKLKPGAADTLSELDAALKKLPSGAMLAEALDEVAVRARTTVAEARKVRTDAFGRLETAFIKAAEAEGQSLREIDNGWRIGGFEIQLDREQSRARVLVNREVVLNWAAVQGAEALPKLLTEAAATVSKAALPEEQLAELFWAAYEAARDTRRRQGVAAYHRVPVRELYGAFHLALISREINPAKPGTKITTVQLPLWLFLYNLDRYRALGSAVPEEKRLSMETGSQKEVAGGMGMVVNGLDARRDYQVICYIVPVKG